MKSSSEGISVEDFLDCLKRAERHGWREATLRDGVAYVETPQSIVRNAKDKRELEVLLGLAE